LRAEEIKIILIGLIESPLVGKKRGGNMEKDKRWMKRRRFVHACIFRKNNIGEEPSVNSFGNSSSADLSFSSKYRGE
jgi:hypothetical protein